MIEATNIKARYGKRDVLHIDDLTVKGGEVTALLGPNAAGKSTLVRCLAGMMPIQSGQVRIEGHDVRRTRARLLSNLLAYVGQENPEAFAFTVRELVAIGAAANTAVAVPESTRIDQALVQMELGTLAERSLLRLSGGERQRAAIARALAQSTPCLILDEPTAHLDLKYQAALMNACRSRAHEHGAAVLIVLHDLNLAAAFADRLILMESGRIVADGTPAVILKSDVIERVYQTHVLCLATPEHGSPWIHIAPPAASSPDTIST